MKHTKKNSIIVCPTCFSPINTPLSGKCPKCKQYQKFVSKDIYSFIEKNYYWGEIPPSDMQRVLKRSLKVGWKSAVRELIKTFPKMEEYLLNHARIDWIFHALPNDKRKKALDIGSGWGGLAFDLTKFFDEVYSLEAVSERFEFQKIRKNQDNVKNIKLVQGNFLKLPFADNSFDLVAVNGVMEWAGIADYSKHAVEVQKDFLKEVHRVLKPGGVVYVGIENRFGLHYLLGAEDHSGLPFTSVMPRFLADLTVRFLRKTEGRYKLSIRMKEDWRDYRTYTYTLDGYKKLLSQCQFKIVDPYWTLFYSNPKFSGPMDGASFKFFLKYIASNTSGGKKSFGGLVSKLGIWAPEWVCALMAKWFSPSFLLFAYKQKRTVTLESEIRNRALNHTSFLKMGGSAGDTSKINYFFLKGKKLVQVAKFSRFADANKDLKKEEGLSSKFGNIKKPIIKSISDRTIFYEKPINGKHPDVNSQNDLTKIIDWLQNFQQKTGKSISANSEILKDINKFAGIVESLSFSKTQKSVVLGKLNSLKKSLVTTKVRKCASHGDFCARNILIDSEKVFVLDWEDYIESSNQLIDFGFFVIHALAHNGDLLSTLKEREFSIAVFKDKFEWGEIHLIDIIVFVSLWYMDKYTKDGKHLGHGNFYLSVLSKI